MREKPNKLAILTPPTPPNLLGALCLSGFSLGGVDGGVGGGGDGGDEDGLKPQ